MSGINRFLSRREKHKKEPPQEKVTSPPMPPNVPTPTSSASSFSHASSSVSISFPALYKHSSSSSLSSLSLAFFNQRTKGVPIVQAVQGIVHSSTANTSDDCLLQPKQISGHLHGLFTDYEEGLPEKDEAKKISALSKRLLAAGINTFKEPDIKYALKTGYVEGDTEKAFKFLVLLEESEEGIIKDYNPNVKLLGAVNRHGVTCYLDATLFAMFARLDSFEAILYTPFIDKQRKRLATLLRLWVNSLRVGRVITVDITQQLQEALAACGWKEAAEKRQQDASEAFSFITEKLELPMLTLKMDIFHTGKEDAADDHRFVRERLLEVAIPEETEDGTTITLEDCLEMYFNSRIEVKRYMERKSTISSMRSHRSLDTAKAHTAHIETVEVDESQPSTPVSAMPISPLPRSPGPQSPLPQYSPVRTNFAKPRAPSIIQENYILEEAGRSDITELQEGRSGRPRRGTLRKEVMMPAWQFFSLIPWYTDTVPSNDAQVAAHFSSKRPVLGICLKRYAVLPNGQTTRRGTHIDIPLEIGLPHFIHDDNMNDDGAAFGNFKLSLQSVVCHRGERVDSGHYVSLVRGQAPNATGPDPTSLNIFQDKWMLFDDLASERVRHVSVEQTLKEESPYLLFYQVQPIDGDPGNIEGGGKPPSYASDGKDSGIAGDFQSPLEPNSSGDDTYQHGRPSFELSPPEPPYGRSSMSSERRLSVTFTDDSLGGTGKPEASTDATSNGSIPGSSSLAVSRRNSKNSKFSKTSSKSRPVSQSGEKQFAASISRLAGKLSKEKPDSTIQGIDPSIPSEAASPATISSEFRGRSEKSRLKKELKERSKSRLSGNQFLVKGKIKVEKPDRECSVM